MLYRLVEEQKADIGKRAVRSPTVTTYGTVVKLREKVHLFGFSSRAWTIIVKSKDLS